jgi:hypothetical protein
MAAASPAGPIANGMMGQQQHHQQQQQQQPQGNARQRWVQIQLGLARTGYIHHI